MIQSFAKSLSRSLSGKDFERAYLSWLFRGCSDAGQAFSTRCCIVPTVHDNFLNKEIRCD